MSKKVVLNSMIAWKVWNTFTEISWQYIEALTVIYIILKIFYGTSYLWGFIYYNVIKNLLFIQGFTKTAAIFPKLAICFFTFTPLFSDEIYDMVNKYQKYHDMHAFFNSQTI